MPIRGICSVPDCEKPHYGHGFCRLHWARWKKNGDPLVGDAMRGIALDYFENVVLRHDSDACLIWPFGKCGWGYGYMTRNGERFRAHRLVCNEMNGLPPSPDHYAAHSCGVRDCVNWRHVRWATSSENKADELVHGTRLRGAIHGMAKLTETQVLRIRNLGASGVFNQAQIADMFGVSVSHVGLILCRGTWKHI